MKLGQAEGISLLYGSIDHYNVWSSATVELQYIGIIALCLILGYTID